MSWIKRRGQNASPNPATGPPVQMYNPNQHSSVQSTWQQPDLQAPSNNWYTQTSSNQQKSYPSNYNQPLQQSGYWQQQSYNQQNQPYNENVANQYNQQYSQYNQPQSYYENNYQQQNYSQNAPHNYESAANHIEQPKQPEADTWNWGWGDEDNSNVQTLSSNNTNLNTNQSNSLVDSFANDEAWNWTVEDASNTNIPDLAKNQGNTDAQLKTTDVDRYSHNVKGDGQEALFPKMGKLAEKYTKSSDSSHHSLKDNEQKTNPSPTSYSESLSVNQAVGRISPKTKDNLTPQWSTESQLSQDSSDLLHTSESDKSHMLSRSSTISESPVSGGLEASLDSGNRQYQAEQDHKDSAFYKQNNFMQHENREVLSSSKDDVFKNNPTPPPPKNQATPPLLPPPSGTNDLGNPYKRTTVLSHKAASKFKNDKQFYAPSASYPVSSSPFNQVNLETLPDNSEQPDSVPQAHQRPSSSKTPVQWPENNEIAPINDRNQYLETGQLSNNEYNQDENQPMVENSDLVPPPGFARMVVGQIEQTDNSLSNQDEPPPGLSRMVLGQTGNSAKNQGEPPVGLHRMVPGESSSPEMSRQQQTYQIQNYGDGEASESELNQPVQMRSGAIGADTPPVTNIPPPNTANRSETIGADQPLPYNNASDKKNSQARSASSSYSNNVRKINADGANLDKTLTNSNNRRDSIEGQPQDTATAISNIVSSIRDLTVGENTTDGANSISERPARRSSRQESTDSEEHEKRAKDRKERRHQEKHDYEREKGRGRYSPSPEQYRDKKHERRRYRDKRYDDESDYYSDKDKDRRRDEKDRRDEYDRKYSSLKKDRDKDRKRREHRSHRDYGREGRRNDYYRYEDDYEDTTRSRPSSRSDSMHDSYRQDRDRRRDMRRDMQRPRDPYNPYMQGYHYDPYNQYYQQYHYQYYENLRRTNPQAYAEWYRKYYQQSSTQQAYGNEDRASVHSGRSSANDELAKDRYTRQSYYSQASLNYYREPHAHSVSGHYGLDESSRQFDQTESSLYLEETTAVSQRLTPAKFATAHIKASISSGHLVKVFPHYPLDGQTATIEVSNLHDLLSNDDEYKELLEFPGPLVKGVTHKKTIIEYCENKIRSAIYSRDIIDIDSYILMWELLILLLRQNGMVVGTDIAELLMKDKKHQSSRRASVVSNSSSGVADPSEASNLPVSEANSNSSVLKEEVVTNKFRDYLIYGSGKEALEWAMKHGLWGHALFLASKLDKRTYANVMTRFANGLPMNDPLQTLYQLLSGKTPAAVTSVADEKWGDWRPHLAMILSNTTQRPELDRKAITTLADTLLSRGSLYAAQFCYLMAQVGFSRYGCEGAKLVLLGSNHNRPFLEFAVNEAIHMTEVYEYACSLNDSTFLIPEFQPYKYLLATRLADYGLLEKSLAYLEKVALSILQNPGLAQQSLVAQVCELGDRLKYYDPTEGHLGEDGDLDISRPDNSWLKELRVLEKDFNTGLIAPDRTTGDYTNAAPEVDLTQPTSVYDQSSVQQESWQQQYQQWQPPQYTEQQTIDYQQNQQNSQELYGVDQYQEQPQQQQYWANPQQWGDTQEQPASIDTNTQQQEGVDQQLQNHYWNNVQTQQEEVEKQQDEDVPRPQISMPNQSQGRSIFDEEDRSQKPKKGESPVKPKPAQPEKPATAGWFGGIWNKLSLRPKNQMKLPDDKNPTIVWDENKKRWMNLDAEGDSAPAELKPPPKMTDMFSNQQPITEAPRINPPLANSHLNSNPSFHQNPQVVAQNYVPNQGIQNSVESAPSEEPNPMKPNQPNIFKLQKNRNIKKAYVDVFNPGAKSSNNNASLPAPDAFGAIPSNGPQMNYFVPAPVNDPHAPTDFLTPTPLNHVDDNAQQTHHAQ